MNTEKRLRDGVENKKWAAVPFEPADLPAIGQFFKKQYNGPGTYGTMGMFQWKIIDNYVRPGIINLVKDNGKIVCSMSVTPKRLFLGGDKNIVAEIGDIYTDLKYRRQGMFALLANQSTKETIEKGINFVYGLPNAQAQPGWEKRANYKTIPNINIKSLVFPINIKHFVQKRSHWLVGNYADSLFSTLIYTYSLAKKAFSPSPAVQVEELEYLPDGWDDFWEKSRHLYDFIFARDKKALIWRFFKNQDKYKFYVLREKDQIIGYIVYRIIYSPENITLYIADFLYLPGRESDMKVLLFKILEESMQNNVTAMAVWCTQGSPYFNVFKKFGFIERGNIPIICFQNDFALGMVEPRKIWHFTISDSDNI